MGAGGRTIFGSRRSRPESRGAVAASGRNRRADRRTVTAAATIAPSDTSEAPVTEGPAAAPQASWPWANSLVQTCWGISPAAVTRRAQAEPLPAA